MMSDKDKVYRALADMEIGHDFTLGDLGIECFGEGYQFVRVYNRYLNDILYWMVKYKVLAVTKTERDGSTRKFWYKKIDNFCYKKVVVEWTEGSPDDWLATTYVNGEIVKVAKDW